jgi:hypothetical protein
VIAAPTTIFDQKLIAVHPFVKYVIERARPKKYTVQGTAFTCVNDVVQTEDDYVQEEYPGEVPTLGNGQWAEKMSSTEAWEEFQKQFKADEAITIRESC